MLKKIVTAMSSPKCTAVYQRFSPGTFEGGEAPNTGKGRARSISDYLAGRDDFGPIKSDTRVTDHKASRRSPGNAGLCKIILLITDILHVLYCSLWALLIQWIYYRHATIDIIITGTHVLFLISITCNSSKDF